MWLHLVAESRYGVVAACHANRRALIVLVVTVSASIAHQVAYRAVSPNGDRMLGVLSKVVYISLVIQSVCQGEVGSLMCDLSLNEMLILF